MSMRKLIVIGLVLNLAVSLAALTETGPENHGLGPVTMNPASPPDRCACEEGNVTATGTAETTCAGEPIGSVSDTKSVFHQEGEVGPITVTVVLKWTCSHGKEFTSSSNTVFNFTEEACVACAAGSCPDEAGGGSGGNKCINLKINLGKSGSGRSAGYFWLFTNYPSVLLSSPQSLTVFHPAADVEIITDNIATGVLRQVRAPECLANIVTNSIFRYTIEFYFPQDISGENPESGYYEVNAGVAPFATWTLENPAQSTTNINTLKITAVKGGATRIYEYEWSQEGGTAQWSLATGNGLKHETLLVESNGTDIIETRTVKNDAGVLASIVKKTYRNYDWGRRQLIKSEVDQDGQCLTTSWTYYIDPAQTGRYGRIASKVEPNGRWTRYDYDQQSRLSKKVESWLDASTNAPENESKVTEFGYAAIYEYYLLTNSVVTNGLTNSVIITNYVDTLMVSPDKPRSTAVKILGQVVSRTYNAYYENMLGQRVELEEICAEPNAGFGAPGNQRTEKIINPKEENSPGAERIASITYPDGRKDTYAYEFGVYTINADPTLCGFTPNCTSDYVRVTVVHGSSDHPGGLAWKSTKAVGIEDYVGRPLLEETYVYTGIGFERIAWTLLSRDEFGRELTRENSDGTRANTSWGCCNRESEKDTTGIERTFSYDALKRLEFTSKVGTAAGTYPAQADIYTTYTYDAADRQLTEVISSSGLSMGRTNQYDLAGRLISSSDFAGLTAATAYSQDGLTTTETLPGGFTRITERFKDGQMKSITGTAQISQYYEYGVNADGTKWTKVFTSAAASPVWVKTTTDFLGRTAKMEKPGYSTTEVTEYFYNTKGQLIRQSTANGPQSLFAYDELGNQIQSGLDVNGNGTLDLAGTDRITESDTSYEQVSGFWYLASFSRLYATDNSSTPLTSTTRQRLTGFAANTIAETISVDSLGNQTVATTVLDRNNKKVTQTVNVPNSTGDDISITVNGLLVSAQRSTLNTPTLYAYDALGRRTRATDPRLGNAVTHYESHGWIDYVEDAAGNRSTFTYDSATGRKLSQTDPLSNTTYYAYTAHGQLEKTWGSATYPVAYEYDAYGRMSKMHTYRGPAPAEFWNGAGWPASPGAADTTEWIYHEASGLLTAKKDAAGKQVSYTYTGNSKLETRNWARTDGTNSLVTTYTYNSAGDLIAIDYSSSPASPEPGGGGTPDVSFTYDRLGRQKTASSSVSAHTFAYSGLLLDSETIITSAGTNVIDRSYDGYGRSTGFSLDSDYQVAYGYDSLGRFAAITSSVESVSSVVNYSYLPNSDLIETLSTDNGLLTTRSYESHRNLLTQVKNTVDSQTISQFDYANDAGGRRTSVKHSGSAFETGAAFNKYDYNNRSEVIVGDKFWGTDINDTGDPVLGQNFAYAYDNIGNRTLSSRDNEEMVYTANSLNQYLQRTVPDGLDVLGSAETNVTVTVNDLPTSRHEKYWHRLLEATNDMSAIWQEVNVVGVYNPANSGTGPSGTNEPDVVSSETGHIFVAKTLEQFAYDDDGNMIQDGRFNYTWDAENRLIAVETATNKVGTAVPAVRLEFQYDYMSRRISKTVYNWISNGWAEIENRKFIYDGWNLIKELSTTEDIPTGLPSSRVIDYFVWGLDLSGSLQGSGGIGGLLGRVRKEERFFNDQGLLVICHRPPGNPENCKTLKVNAASWPAHSAHGDTLGSCSGATASSFLYTFDANGNVSELLQSSVVSPLSSVAHYEYSPFGETIVATGPEAEDNPFRFSTKYFVNELGIGDWGRRWYLLPLGRWLSRDPIDELGGVVILKNYLRGGGDRSSSVGIEDMWASLSWLMSNIGVHNAGLSTCRRADYFDKLRKMTSNLLPGQVRQLLLILSQFAQSGLSDWPTMRVLSHVSGAPPTYLSEIIAKVELRNILDHMQSHKRLEVQSLIYTFAGGTDVGWLSENPIGVHPNLYDYLGNNPSMIDFLGLDQLCPSAQNFQGGILCHQNPACENAFSPSPYSRVIGVCVAYKDPSGCWSCICQPRNVAGPSGLPESMLLWLLFWASIARVYIALRRSKYL